METKVYLVANYTLSEQTFTKLQRKPLKYKKCFINHEQRVIQFKNIKIPKTRDDACADLATFFAGYLHLIIVNNRGDRLLTNVTVEYQQENPPSARKQWEFDYIIVAFDRELGEKHIGPYWANLIKNLEGQLRS